MSNALVTCVAATVAFVVVFNGVDGLDNGLALTPPMGWLAWQRFRCITDCETYPNECVSEKLFMNAADYLVSEGYADLGYNYVIVDDCWLSKNRTADGKMEADKTRFPNGIKALSDYVHSKGLKFGLYQNWGRLTCAGYPGVLGSEAMDAQQFADWGVDYVKLDGCYSNVRDMDRGYAEFGQHLNKTGRPMVYSCSWPAYQEEKGMWIDYAALAKHCNLWRNYGDVDDSWNSVTNIADYFAIKQEFWAKYAGPGHWNDPDMLLIGNYGLTVDQSKSQMAIWALLAAPLMMSNDLSSVQMEFKEILQNKEVIRVNQDALGIQGTRVFRDQGIEIWTRAIEPVHHGQYSYALAFLSRRTDGAPYPYNVKLEELGLNNKLGYLIKNLFDKRPAYQTEVIYALPKSLIKVRINPTGVVFLRLDVIQIKLENVELYDGALNHTMTFT